METTTTTPIAESDEEVARKDASIAMLKLLEGVDGPAPVSLVATTTTTTTTETIGTAGKKTLAFLMAGTFFMPHHDFQEPVPAPDLEDDDDDQKFTLSNLGDVSGSGQVSGLLDMDNAS